MKQKIRALGAGLVAVLAFAGLGAQQAAAFAFEADVATVVTTGHASNWKLSITGNDVTCTVTWVSHTTGSTPTSFKVTPTHTGCTAFGFINAKVTGFGHYEEEATCDYVLNANGTLDLECDEGAAVVIDAGTCTATIPEQTGLGTVGYKNVANGDIEVGLDVSEITLDHVDGFLCPFSGSGEDQKIGLEEGAFVVSGESAEGEPIDIAWSDTG